MAWLIAGCKAKLHTMNGLDLIDKLSEVGFSAKTYSFDDVPGAYIDRNINSPKVESDKYLFFCEK